jgi:phosphoadenosine phosphosulfate reductase
MDKAIARHEKVVLQFSGGKDSLACLHLLRAHWDKVLVLWLDTGDAFPETHKQMQEIARLVPHFMTVKSNQPGQTLENGPPSDVVNVWGSKYGRLFTEVTLPVQAAFECCGANIWTPMDEACKKLGTTLIIRGQRAAEKKKGPTYSGQVIDGVEYLFPLEAWSRQQVIDYLLEEGVGLPGHYKEWDSSLDCMTCTAYLDDNQPKMHYLRRYHPNTADLVELRLGLIAMAVQPALLDLSKAHTNIRRP